MRSFRRLLVMLALSAQLFVLSSAAAGAVTDLAPGLRYLRIASLNKSASELTEALHNLTPLVLDLRYVTDENDGALALLALNSEPAKPKLTVLVSPETPKDVAEALRRSSTRLVILGIRKSRPEPDVVIEQTATDDRKAYEAVDHGASLESLVSGKLEKEHFDEAQLVKEFKNGNRDAHPADGDPDGKPDKVPLTDRVLQRALQLHKALQALKR